MREKKFLYPIDDPDVQQRHDILERSFLQKDFINPKELKEFAIGLAQDIQRLLIHAKVPEEQAAIIVYFLNAEDILSKARHFGFTVKWVGAKEFHRSDIAELSWEDKQGLKQTDQITIQELEVFLYPIRQAVLEELSTMIDRNSIQLIKRSMTQDQRIWELHDGRVLKMARDNNPNLEPEPEEDKKGRLEALTHLFGLRERSPYIAYQILGIELTTEAHEGSEIQRKIEITTLDKLLEDTRAVSLNKALGYVRDAMQGAQFLVDHDMRMTDFAPDNIGIDLVNGRGMLFDYDGLRMKDHIVKGYATHIGYCPPERIPPRQKGEEILDDFDRIVALFGPVPPQIKGPIQPQEMIYEFGSLIETVLKKYGQESLADILLVRRMHDHNPANRPSFLEVRRALEEYLSRPEI